MDFTITSPRITRDQILSFVPIDVVKRSERVVHNREDELVGDNIVAAYGWLTRWLNGFFMLEETVEVYVPTFGNTFEIALRPIVAEQAILFERRLPGGAFEDVAADDYAVARQDECVVVSSLSRTAFPRQSDPIHPRSFRLSFKVGHADKADIPEGLRKSIILLAGHWYNHREAAFADPRTGQVSREIEFGVRSLAGIYRFAPDHS